MSGTPAGERHELGALLSAVSGAAEGWEVVYLGPDLPSEDIVMAALKVEAEVVALSCVEPTTAEGLPQELRKVRERLPADVRLIVGGPLVEGNEQLTEIDGLEVLSSFQDLRDYLRDLGASG